MQPKLKFVMDIPNKSTGKLLEGKLYLEDDDSHLVFLATSGQPSYQYFGAWKIPRRGLLPPSAQIPRPYSLSTNGLYLPHVPGVEGSFFPISPFMVRVDGVERGDFGIHFDANVPGSAGCIVIRLKDHWEMFKEAMHQYHVSRIKAVNLEVVYT